MGFVAQNKMKKVNVLGLALYGSNAASTRIRLSQYIPGFSSKNIHMDINSLLDNHYLENLYSKKKIPFITVTLSYFKRILILIFKRKYQIYIVHCELFPFFPYFLEKFLLGKNYIYDFDDAFYLKYLSGKYSFLKIFLGKKFEKIITNASYVSAGSKALYEYASQFNKNVILLPSVVDTNNFSPTRNWEEKRYSHRNPLVLGWIGSPSTEKYLNILIKPLSNLGKKIPIKFLVVGGSCPDIPNVHIEELAWDEGSEVKHINLMDIGLMPLQDDEWSRGKCGFKLVQYLSCKIPVIASNVGANNEIVDRRCGFLVSNEDGWVRFINKLYNDSRLIRSMGSFGRNRILEHYSLKANLPKFISIILSANER